MSTTFPATISARIASSIRAGHYSLLLGAGASLDSKNLADQFLPTGNAFRRDLCAEKHVSLETPLQRVYGILSDDEVDRLVTARFQVSRTGRSVEKLTRFLWRRAFTFNIDNALELAYRNDLGSFQLPASFHFNDSFEDALEQSKLQIAHLHGWVENADKGYVFSRSEYVRQINSINPWMVNLAQFISVDPFIVAGTSLDEIDLEYYLSHRSPTSARSDRGPSILVEPNPDDITRRECDKFGLMLYEGTISDFLDYLDAEVPSRPLPIDLVSRTVRDLFPANVSERDVISFSADFELVPAHAHADAQSSRFFYGYPPTWDDLASSADVGRTLTADIIDTIEERIVAPPGAENVLLLLEKVGTGKTTVLRRVGFELATRGFHVLICSPLGRLELQSTARLIDSIRGKLVILVDNLADQVSAISDIIDLIKRTDLVFLCAERSYRASYVHRSLAGVGVVECDGLELTGLEIEQLITSYFDRGLLGATAALSERHRFKKALEGDSIALACCRILKDFRPLDRIVRSVLKDVDDKDKERYKVSALAQYCLRGGVRYEVLSSITGREGWDYQFSEAHPLPLTYAESARSFIVPLSATMAARVLDFSTEEELLPIFVKLGKAIASRVNRAAIRSRVPEARLASRLFDYDQVVHGFLGDLADKFYAETRAEWQWNSRYWEQLALRNLSRYFADPAGDDGEDSLIRALQHARHAVSIEYHPLPLTTLSKVLFSQMRHEPALARKLFEEAFNGLVEALRMERRRSRITVHPFMTMFTGTRDYIAGGGRLSEHQVYALRGFADAAIGRFARDFDVQGAVGDILAIINAP